MTTTAVPTRPTPADPQVAFWFLVGACWVGMAGLVLSGDHAHGAVTAAPVWLLMLGAMMLPTVAPLMRLFGVVSARAPGPRAARAGLYTGYLAVWVAFVPVALLGAAGASALASTWGWLAARPGLVLGAALLVAGAYQFSPLKNACLRACRDPMGFLWQHYRRGPWGGWLLGVRHGLSCLGCCWALMLVMFVTGVGSLAWMLALTGVMVVEKVGRRGARLVTPVGIALLVAGVVASAAALVTG